MRKLTKLIIGISIIIGCFIAIGKFSDIQSEKNIEKRISNGFSGLVIDKFFTRDTKPTFVKIKTSEGIQEISILTETIEKIQIGDSLIKNENSKFGIIKRKSGLQFIVPIFNDYVMENY